MGWLNSLSLNMATLNSIFVGFGSNECTTERVAFHVFQTDSRNLCGLLLVWYYTTILGKMVQLTVEERKFLVTTFHQTRSLLRTQETFRECFPERVPPSNKTVWANVRKYREHGTNLKGNSGRRRTGRSDRRTWEQ